MFQKALLSNAIFARWACCEGNTTPTMLDVAAARRDFFIADCELLIIDCWPFGIWWRAKVHSMKLGLPRRLVWQKIHALDFSVLNPDVSADRLKPCNQSVPFT